MAIQTIFRFERVLELRQRETENCERRLFQKCQAVGAAAAACRAVSAEREDLNRAWASGAAVGFRPDEALDFQYSFAACERRAEAARRALENARKEEAEARAILSQALQRQKSIEKLRSRWQERQRLESNRREQAELDDIAILRERREAS